MATIDLLSKVILPHIEIDNLIGLKKWRFFALMIRRLLDSK